MGTILLLCFLTVMFSCLEVFVSFVSCESVQEDAVAVDVYVIDLVGVVGHGADNVSRVVEGVLWACHVDTLRYWTDEIDWSLLYPYHVYKSIEIDVNVTVMNDWTTYRSVVESGCGVIIVNAHGETIPVPSGYSRVEWVNEIAEAMITRNVTWVHTAGYPFFYYYSQDSGEGIWGEYGFQNLTSHINLSDVTCYPSRNATDSVDMNIAADFTLFMDWPDLSNAMRVERGRPLKASDFSEFTVLPIWGSKDDYMTGAVIKFGKAGEIHEFGFYVHIGTRKTYDFDNTETDSDYWRGYAEAAAAIYYISFKSASEKAMLDAETAIGKAEEEGRTKGLDEAIQLLQDAKDCYDIYGYDGALLSAKKATAATDKAVKPSFIETYLLPMVVLGMVGASAATSLAIIRTNSKKVRQKREN